MLEAATSVLKWVEDFLETTVGGVVLGVLFTLLIQRVNADRQFKNQLLRDDAERRWQLQRDLTERRRERFQKAKVIVTKIVGELAQLAMFGTVKEYASYPIYIRASKVEALLPYQEFQHEIGQFQVALAESVMQVSRMDSESISDDMLPQVIRCAQGQPKAFEEA
jgi:malate synthase